MEKFLFNISSSSSSPVDYSSSSSTNSSSTKYLRVLCLGDIVGKVGRQVVREHVLALKKQLDIHMVIANGENSAGGIGMIPKNAEELLTKGVDVLTSGNHIWRHKECRHYLDKESRVLRPANYPSPTVGRGYGIYSIDGVDVAVINLMGRIYMDPLDCPFKAVDAILHELAGQTQLIVVDFHAEATSEKRAMAHYLNGRVSFVFGTHTHVQTADAFISAKGTASLTDLGMCGVEENSVIGMAQETSLARLISGIPRSFVTAKGKGSLNGAIVAINRTTGKAENIMLLRSGATHICSVG